MSETTATTPQAAATGLLCPVCRVDLVMSERQGIEIDYCPKCRGVWLDRGELDKIIERAATAEAASGAPVPPQAPPQSPQPQPSPWLTPQPQYQPPPAPYSGGSGHDGGHHGSGHGGGHHGGDRGHNSFLGKLFR